MPDKNSPLKDLLLIILGALLLIKDGLLNGFPLVYSDTATYLSSGFELEMPFDRPITYGLFLRVFSLNGYTLWSVIFMQGLLISILIHSLYKTIFPNNKQTSFWAFSTILFLSLFTGLSWTVSQIMTDIFTPIALLTLILILFGKYTKWKTGLLYFLFILSVGMHASHILMFIIIILLLFIARKRLFPFLQPVIVRNKLILLTACTLSAIVTMGPAISKSKHVFFMGAMVEHGIAKEYLNDHCAEKDYKLCAYKDSFPEYAYQFIWLENSPFYKVGGWKETKKEFNEIIFGSLTQPKFIGMHIKESLKATGMQLLSFSVGDGNNGFNENTILYQRIERFLPQDITSFQNAKQNVTGFYYLNFYNLLFKCTLYLSLLATIILLVKNYSSKNNLTMVAIIIITGIIINAWDCGTFANAIDRLGCKIIWLLPLTAISLLISWKNTSEQ